MEFQIQPSPLLRTSKSTFETGVRGTWTPEISCNTPGNLVVGYDINTASFIRIGDILTLDFFIQFTPIFTTATGDLFIKNRPYFDKVLNNTTGAVGTSRVILSTNYTFISLVAQAELDKLVLLEHGSNQTFQIIQIQTGLTTLVSHTINGTITCRLSDVS